MLNQIFPNVPAILPAKNNIRRDSNRMIHSWSFPKSRIGETVLFKGERVKKLLTLDINLPEEKFAATVNELPVGSDEALKKFKKDYPCIHSCDGCFNNAKLTGPIMTLPEIIDVIDQGCELGMESVKFLGPGELTVNPELFNILDEFRKRGIIVGLFTKAAIFGDDALAQHYHGMSAAELTRRVAAYWNVTFLVGARSFDPMRENRFIPPNLRYYSQRFDYHAVRNTAIERLCALKMHKDAVNLRMALICSPVAPDNISDAFDLYKWGTERNMPVYMPPTMVSGKGHRLKKGAQELPFEDRYIQLATDVYTWAIQRGVMTLEQFRDEGAHPYLGATPCNQLTHGMYFRYDGRGYRCPGNDDEEFVVAPDVRKEPLVDIWKRSKNYRIQAFNNGCVKDGISLPTRFYKEVPRAVEARLAA